MRLHDVGQVESPLGGDRVRLAGRVAYDTTGIADDTLWFDVDAPIAPALSRGGNPWLAALLPVAATMQEPLEIDLPVDPRLLEGAGGLLQVWGGWFPEFPAVTIAAPIAESEPDTEGRSAVCFSLGLDSFHTLLRHADGGDAIDRVGIDDLLTVHGFDIPVDAGDAFARVRDRVARVAGRVGADAVTVATNLRESGWSRCNWGRMGQGPALAAVAHALEGRLGRLLVPSSTRFSSLRHWGTHPLTDPLLSTSHLEVRDDGAQSGRWQKAEAVARSELAMGELRVCWIGGDDRNCGACEKCLRTLTVFEILGVRDRAVSFPADAWSLDALASLRYRNDLDRRYQSRMAERAMAAGRPEIARAIRRAIRMYDVRRGGVRLLRRVGLR